MTVSPSWWGMQKHGGSPQMALHDLGNQSQCGEIR
jgi:hypothetical protein